MPKPLPRRTLLRGAGAALALPWLDAMAHGPAEKPPVRFAALYFPNGVNPHHWTPEGKGAGFKLSKTLAPLAPHQKDILVLSNLWNAATDTGDGHYVKSAAWLCGTTIAKTTGADVRSNHISVDQFAAQRLGHLTALPSLELGTEPAHHAVDLAVGYTRLYGSAISWSGPATPAAKEIDPRLAFGRIFRRGAGKRAGADDRSVLDAVREDAQTLRNALGADDRRKLEEYLESVRAVETRIDFEARRAGQRVADPQQAAELAGLDARIGKFAGARKQLQARATERPQHVELMLDLIALAFWTDATRIATFMFANDVSNVPFTFVDGVKGSHHEMSHHENNADKLAQYQKINEWHAAKLAYLLKRLSGWRDAAGGTVLDNSMILFGAAIRDGNAHDPHNLPLVLAGGGGGTIAGGRHLEYAKNSKLCDLYRGVLRRLGTPAERFADSDRELPGLDDPKFSGA